mgnify:CR=1 FL=1
MAKTKPTFYPAVGEHLYLRQFTGNYWVDMVKRPYTVVSVDTKKNIVTVQECELIFNGPRYYDTIADEIKADADGRTLQLRFANAKGYRNKWIEKGRSTQDYPLTAVFGNWVHQPYLD